MKDWLKVIGMVLGVILLFGVGCAWQIYAFKDCKKVGHSTLYCIGKIGK